MRECVVCVREPPPSAVCAPEVLFANEAAAVPRSEVGGGSVPLLPYFYVFVRAVCEQPVKIAAGWFRSPALGLRIICHVVPVDSLQLSPPTLLTRAPLSSSGLWLLKVGAGYPSFFPLPR